MEGVAEAVTVEVCQELPRSAANRLIGKDHFVDAIEAPFVVGRHLVDPLDRTGIEVTRPYRHRPAIVTGALHRVPCRGIARTIIDELQFGIVRIPTPCGAATDLPLVALPGGRR